tara:strand:- start:12 stop:611 length:600 start_codon:yes stop_codon:yes gene_type:complete
MKFNFNQHIGIFESALEDVYCNEIIDIFDKHLPFAKNRQQEGSESLQKSDLSLGGLQILKPHQIDHLYNIINQALLPLYMEKYYGVKEQDYLLPLIIQDYKLQKTSPSEGYHIWHSEWSPIPDQIHRFLAWTLYLNDVEDGGETEFLHQNKRISPKKGTVCFFPAYFTHIHRGNPPLSGDKYIATGWITFDNSPKPPKI